MRRLNIRFQHWVMVTTCLLVVTLSAVFLLTVFRTFEGVAEERATSRFVLIADHVWSKLDGMLQESGRFVSAQAKAEPATFADAGGRLAGQALVPTFLASLDAGDEFYSHFFALGNNEFLQIVAIRDNAKIVATLQAPAGAWFAVRRISGAGSQPRSEEWTFLDVDRKFLARRVQPATLVPTQRPWYAGALDRNGLVLTDPYVFASSGELGITVATPLSDRAGVLASDISLASLQKFVEQLSLPSNGAVVILDGRGRVLAFHGKGTYFASTQIAALTAADQIDHPYLTLLREPVGNSGAGVRRLGAGDGERFVVARKMSQPIGGAAFNVVVLAPLSDFLGPFRGAERDVMLMALLVIAVLVPLSFFASRQVAHALQRMASDSERMKHLDFSEKPQVPQSFLYEINALGDAQCVMHDAIQNRTEALKDARDKLESLIRTGIELGQERDRMALLRKILFGGKNLLHCDAGTLYLVTDHKTLSFALRTKTDDLASFEIPLYDEEGKPVERYMATWCALHNAPIIVDDVYSESRFDVSGAKAVDAKTGYHTVSMLTVPLSPREGEVIGVLQFLNALDPVTGQPVPFDHELVRFVTAMAAQAAVALNNFQLIEAQEKLMDSMITLIAGAIDAKSPYTGGHCERVPELAIMLAREACAVDHGPLADFAFTTEEQWREFRIGAWLHDCGKVTTPEYVVDKATKLETIYNRIHEIRTRFEVLLRDAEIERLTAIHERGEAPALADARFAERKAELLDDFAFLAECNLGGEFMAGERIERVKRLAGESWVRHFDDRIGLSQGELRRYAGVPPAALPVREALLADQPWHVLPRHEESAAFDPSYGWKVTVPENLYNFGEIYNLCVGRGTLTEEERFKINEHIIQTIAMLEQLPLPKHLKRVPEYAGTHHETMIGTGYPRRLTADELSVPSRIMAIADIFEALTASDRPYKQTKTLSECIKILSFFKKDKHIDPVLFDLFLTSGVYLKYAERYLKPEQIDAVDLSQYIQSGLA